MPWQPLGQHFPRRCARRPKVALPPRPRRAGDALAAARARRGCGPAGAAAETRPTAPTLPSATITHQHSHTQKQATGIADDLRLFGSP